MSTNPLEIFTSTGIKYLRQPDMVKGIRSGVPRPVSLQVSPTNQCQLRCVFCSVDERDLSLEWELEDLKKLVRKFYDLGIKTVEFSGGGDPTAYKSLPQIVEFCKSLGLKIGMITNGVALDRLPRETLESFAWIRISMVTLDYHETIKIPQPWPENTVLGMSYVVGQIDYTGTPRKFTKSDDQGLRKVADYARRYNAAYVRVVPECLTGSEMKMAEIHKSWIPVVEEIGPPLFFQSHKWQKQAKQCWMDMIKPWAHSDGYIYPCNSVSLNTEARRDFDPKWRLCHWTEVEKYYEDRGSESLPFVKELCDQCSFTQNNQMIADLIEPMQHEDFV